MLTVLTFYNFTLYMCFISFIIYVCCSWYVFNLCFDEMLEYEIIAEPNIFYFCDFYACVQSLCVIKKIIVMYNLVYQIITTYDYL